MRKDFGSIFRIKSGYALQPCRLVKLPIPLTTFPNTSGRSHAAVNAQLPPELPPTNARPAGSSPSGLAALRNFGQNFLNQKPRVAVADRIVFKRPVLARLLDRPLFLLRRTPCVFAGNFDFDGMLMSVEANVPGLTKIPIVTGISFL